MFNNIIGLNEAEKMQIGVKLLECTAEEAREIFEQFSETDKQYLSKFMTSMLIFRR